MITCKKISESLKIMSDVILKNSDENKFNLGIGWKYKI